MEVILWRYLKYLQWRTHFPLVQNKLTEIRISCITVVKYVGFIPSLALTIYLYLEWQWGYDVIYVAIDFVYCLGSILGPLRQACTLNNTLPLFTKTNHLFDIRLPHWHWFTINAYYALLYGHCEMGITCGARINVGKRCQILSQWEKIISILRRISHTAINDVLLWAVYETASNDIDVTYKYDFCQNWPINLVLTYSACSTDHPKNKQVSPISHHYWTPS